MSSSRVFSIHDPFEGALGDYDDVVSFGIAFERVVYLVSGNRSFAVHHGAKYPHLRFTHDGDPALPDLFRAAETIAVCAPITEEDCRLYALMVGDACAGKTVYLQGNIGVGYNITTSASGIQTMLALKPGVLDFSTNQTNRALSFRIVQKLVPDRALLGRVMQYSIFTLVLPPAARDKKTVKNCLPHRLYVEGAPGFAGNNLKGLLKLLGIAPAGRNASWVAADYFLTRFAGHSPASEDPATACHEALQLPQVQAILATPPAQEYLGSPNEAGVAIRDWKPEYTHQLEVGVALMLTCVPAWLSGAFQGSAMPDRSTPFIAPLEETEIDALLDKESSPMWDLVLLLAIFFRINPAQLAAKPQPMEDWLIALIPFFSP